MVSQRHFDASASSFRGQRNARGFSSLVGGQGQSLCPREEEACESGEPHAGLGTPPPRAQVSTEWGVLEGPR